MKKNILMSLIVLLSAHISMAGAPGFESYFCTSASGKTNLTVVNRFEGAEGLTMVLSIREFSVLYDKVTMYCNPDECQRMEISYGDNGVSFYVKTAEVTDLQVDIGYNGKGTIRKGFVHPETLMPFKSDIQLICKRSEQQI